VQLVDIIVVSRKCLRTWQKCMTHTNSKNTAMYSSKNSYKVLLIQFRYENHVVSCNYINKVVSNLSKLRINLNVYLYYDIKKQYQKIMLLKVKEKSEWR
jgi:hypothetical protein